VRLHDLLDGLEHFGGFVDTSVEVRGDDGARVRAVVHDSRHVVPGALFCCIPGAHTDGHDHAPAAVAAGAIACLVERWLDVDVPQVRVRSVRGVLGPICARFHGEPSRAMRVLGVTGTNGKTTTTYLLDRIAAAAGERTGIIGTTGARIDGESLPVPHTTPEATELQPLLARMRDAGVDTVAMEVSSHSLDQHRVDGTRFAVACFTNLSHDHLDYHGTLDAYFAAKERLFTPLFTARAVVGIDDEHGRLLAQRARTAGLDVSTFALDGEADVRVSDVALDAHSSAFTIVDGVHRHRVRTSLVGSFNVANTLAAFTTARAAGFDVDPILAALADPPAVPGRMEPVEAGQPFLVFVDYAHTPAALASVLGATRPFVHPGGRLLVVFGCGGDRDRAKRPVMGSVAVGLSDVAYLTSDNSRSEEPRAIVRDVLAGVGTSDAPVVELDRRQAIRRALRDARPGDVVVIAGKGHESGQTTNGVTVPFDDRIVAREELEARV
jgi:UDP-N-acetylmuramoyl-L-alanyl-D-glutamate--2,6-diaminopimelate ligase